MDTTENYIIRPTPANKHIIAHVKNKKNRGDNEEGQSKKKKKSSRFCYFRFKKRRCFLPFLVFIGFAVMEELHNFIYLPILIAAAAFIIFWNFPIMVYFSNTKPLYYEDLFIDTTKLPLLDIRGNIRKKFEYSFEWTLVVTNSLLMAVLTEYWLYKTVNKGEIMEIVGVTGGILKIFQFINNITGSLMLKFFSRKIRQVAIKEITTGKKRRRSLKKKIELIQLENTKHAILEKNSQNNLVEMVNISISEENPGKTIKITHSPDESFQRDYFYDDCEPVSETEIVESDETIDKNK